MRPGTFSVRVGCNGSPSTHSIGNFFPETPVATLVSCLLISFRWQLILIRQPSPSLTDVLLADFTCFAGVGGVYFVCLQGSLRDGFWEFLLELSEDLDFNSLAFDSHNFVIYLVFGVWWSVMFVKRVGWWQLLSRLLIFIRQRPLNLWQTYYSQILGVFLGCRRIMRIIIWALWRFGFQFVIIL